MAPESVQTEPAAEINRGYLRHIAAWSRATPLPRWQALTQRLLWGDEVRALLFPLLLAVGRLTTYALRLCAGAAAGADRSGVHDRARAHVRTLAEQYPLHFYPIIAKALELAYLTEKVCALGSEQRKVLEVAIGEGTLSGRLWPQSLHLTGLDLNPYSLAKAAQLPHVRRAIVGDGMDPPMRPGAFDLLVSVNFLHHVTDKASVVANWSRVASELLFNENTPFWATGWAGPFLSRALGMKRLAAHWARSIEARSLQHLEDRLRLDEAIEKCCIIEGRLSFYSERTHFLCSLFSLLMRCYGPPTPALVKRWALGPLRRFVLPMTVELAELLLAFDASQDRSRDAFIMYLCRSRTALRDPSPQDLICPRCRGGIDGAQRCGGCGATYTTRDGMLFLLPDELLRIEQQYRADIARAIPREHL